MHETPSGQHFRHGVKVTTRHGPPPDNVSRDREIGIGTARGWCSC